MRCECGHIHQTLAEKIDADQKALIDLRKQEKAQSGPLAKLTRARINQIRAEIAAEKQVSLALGRSRQAIIKALKSAVEVTDPSTLLRFNRDQLAQFLMQAGYADVVGDLSKATDKINEAAQKALEGIAPFDFLRIQDQAFMLQASIAESVIDDVIIPNTISAMRDSLQSLSVGVPINQVASALNQRMKSATGSQLTVLKTKISQYGRDITAVAAREAGLDLFLYTGPVDGITRPFCLPLVNLVVSRPQLNRLNNGQGLSVISAGGGYNCRHSWSPITEGFVQSMGLTRATTANIDQANGGAT